ncbi:MAG: hypothetical protein JO161_02710 [Planctomycetaceae bacterium]|nr:hypothetical protein [Planctomycetaceae bacterium]
MSRNSKGLRGVVREITHGGNRSSLFWWMVENHDQLASAVGGRRLEWTRLCARFAKLGLTDANGHAPSEQTARKTWQRVRRAVAKARELAAANQSARPQRRDPSRITPDWRPPVVSSSDGPGGPIESVRTLGMRPPARPNAGGLPETGGDAPTEFSTVDAEGNPLEEGKVFYRGQVMTRHAAEQLERLRRGLQEEDRFR